jgi:hypothetical protein
MRINELVMQYKENGFTPFPLAPKSKLAPKGSNFDTIENDGAFSEDSNIGLFPQSKNGLIVADADDEESQNNITGRLQAMGLLDQTTIIRTPQKGGKHFWFRVTEVPLQTQCYCQLNSSVGKGELRIHKPAYVVAPPSTLQGGKYTFLQGSIEEFDHQVIVDWKDLTWLLPSNWHGQGGGIEILEPPVRIIYRPSPNAIIMFGQVRDAPKGENIHKINFERGELLEGFYNSRSEAEAAIVTNLILAGWNWDKIQEEFESEQPGHYSETNNRVDYLKRTYGNALRKLSHRRHCYNIASAYRTASLMPWPGNGGDFEQRALLAILSKAWQFDTYQPKICTREISEYSGMSDSSVPGVLERLSVNGNIHILINGFNEIGQYDIKPFMDKCQKLNINHFSTTTVINAQFLTPQTWETAEIWGRSFLGGSAKLVYTHLSDSDGKSPSDLVKLTGKALNTVKSALKNKLEPSGLAKSVDRMWFRGHGSIESIAEEMKTKERAIRRQIKHQIERERFQEEQMKSGKVNPI